MKAVATYRNVETLVLQPLSQQPFLEYFKAELASYIAIPPETRLLIPKRKVATVANINTYLRK